MGGVLEAAKKLGEVESVAAALDCFPSIRPPDAAKGSRAERS
jgi:hypothetical protein